MVLFEDLFGERQVNAVLASLGPGESQNPVYIVAQHRAFGRYRRHPLQPGDFFERALQDFVRQTLFLYALAQFGHLVAAVAG